MISATNSLLLINILISIYYMNNYEDKHKLMFNPYYFTKKNEYYRIFTHSFIHSDFMHLIVNMYVLYNFGNILESEIFPYIFKYPKIILLLSYFIAVIGGVIPSIIKYKDNSSYYSLGASAGVSAILFILILLYPNGKLLLLGIIPLNNLLFGILFIVYEYYMMKRQITNIAHDAHLFGLLTGLSFIIIIYPKSIENIINIIKNF